MRLVIAFAALALTACQQAEAPTASMEEVAKPDPIGEPLTSIGDLIGEYRVAGIDGEPLSGDVGIAVSIDGALLSYDPTCAGFIWRLEFEGETLSAERYSPYPPPAKASRRGQFARLAFYLSGAIWELQSMKQLQRIGHPKTLLSFLAENIR